MKLTEILKYQLFPSRYVIQFSPIRTGSTLIYNILRETLPRKTIEKVHRYSHGFARLPVISTIRHPLDCIASTIRIKKMDPDPETIRQAILEFDKCCIPDILRVAERRTTILFKYEDFIDDLEPVYDALESFFQITITRDDRARIGSKYSVENVADMTSHLKDFAAWDPVTKLHGQHISPSRGRPGSYKEFFTTAQIADLKATYKQLLNTFNYE